jgi:hypothetical protein
MIVRNRPPHLRPVSPPRVATQTLVVEERLDTGLAVVVFLGGLVTGCILMWSVMAVAARAASGGAL